MTPFWTPQVCAICLTADRQALTDRAVACFLAQTYKPSHLLIYDTGKKPYRLNCLASSRITVVNDGHEMARAIGALRNTANGLTPPGTDILIHWDSDDWSSPHRIADQVACLPESGRDCVGYNSVLFWRRGEAWAYTNRNSDYCIGASLCYWRKTWERQPFKGNRPDMAKRALGEDKEFLQHIDAEGFPAIFEDHATLVCEIHGGNTMSYDLEAMQATGDTFWRRAPQFDAKLAELMKL